MMMMMSERDNLCIMLKKKKKNFVYVNYDGRLFYVVNYENYATSIAIIVPIRLRGL